MKKQLRAYAPVLLGALAIALVATVSYGIAQELPLSPKSVNIEHVENLTMVVNGSADDAMGFTGGGTTGLDTLALTADLTVADDATVGDELTIDDATITCVDQTMADATTTTVALPATDLFSSGSMTIVSFTYNQNGVATSSVSYDCGVAATAYTSSDTLIDGLSVATSTAAYETGDYGTNGRINQALDTTEYVTCTATFTNAAYDGALLDNDNTHSGTATVCAIQ